MPDLIQSLQGSDLGHLRIIAQLWEVELNAPDAKRAFQQLAQLLLTKKNLSTVLEGLPAAARQAWEDLLEQQGRMPWALFARRYGALPEMGAARRDREQPYLNTDLPSEMLWYRGLVGRAFFDTPGGPEEFAYVPDDLLALLPETLPRPAEPFGRPASSGERATIIASSEWIVDHATTLLAALRGGLGLDAIGELNFPGNELGSMPQLSPSVLMALLSECGLIDSQSIPVSEPVREFLEARRGQALAQLTQTWTNSLAVNELHLLPDLICEGEWKNDPRRARQVILGFCRNIPAGKWWSMPAFVEAIHQHAPDYQRPAGDYDSWFIRQAGSADYLQGFEHWDAIDGALIRFIFCGPLFWLGCVDLALPAEGSSDYPRPVTAFRLTAWAGLLLAGEAPDILEANDQVTLRSDGRLRVPRLSGRAFRYQVARFVDWQGFGKEAYHYRLTPGSLQRARQQGLRLSHLLALLRRGNVAVPPVLLKALERWEEQGSQARLERVTILRVSNPEILRELRASRAARFLGELLGPAAVIVKEGAGEKVLAALAELGYLGETHFVLKEDA